MFKLNRNSPLSILLMSLGAATILAAVMMALIQKNSKRLLAYHAVSQAGYMILGLGTALPMGIIGGLFHMLNNAIYKCGLFLSAGALEQQAGTTDLEELGGLGRKMPLTFICFIILALSISGVPPLNGFFSKELIYDAALERGFIFYLAALLGSFFTAASFLKFGHAAFLGKISDKNKEVKEAPWTIFMPLVILSLFCVGLGLCHQSALNKVLLPLLGSGELPGHDLGVFPLKTKLVSATLVILLLALFNHIFGVKRRGSGLGAVDHIHFAPGLNWIYLRAEGKCFDPFRWGGYLIRAISGIAFWLDRTLDWFYEVLSGKMMLSLARRLKKLHTENYSLYLTWSLVGLVIILCVLIYT
jgi:NADH-quinone oxidoreductase subunit L